jgi:DNA-binding beta-propeller fold protein YncE
MPAVAQKAPDLNAYRAPAGNRVAQVNPGGETILPNGRIVAPIGERQYAAHSDLFDINISPNGKAIVGHYKGGMTIWQRNTKGAIPISISIKNFGLSGAFTHGGAQYIASNGDAGNGISVYDATSWDLPGIKATPERPFMELDQAPLFTIQADKEAYIQDIVLGPDGHTVYTLDIARQRVVVFDLTKRAVIADVPAGREPFALALNKDGSRLFVANIGIFNYSLVPDPKPGTPFSKRGLRVPPFGFPSKEATSGVDTEGRFVKGLGSARVPDAQSVWAYDVRNPAKPIVTGRRLAF